MLLTMLTALTTSAQNNKSSLKGTWQFAGGVYNGKTDTASTAYTMQRVYSDIDFNAFASEKGYKTERYEAGRYILKGDTCFETQTFSSRPSQLLDKTMVYTYQVKNNNELILSGTLPSGMVVEEHWRRVISARKK